MKEGTVLLLENKDFIPNTTSYNLYNLKSGLMEKVLKADVCIFQRKIIRCRWY